MGRSRALPARAWRCRPSAGPVRAAANLRHFHQRVWPPRDASGRVENGTSSKSIPHESETPAPDDGRGSRFAVSRRSEEHTSELQSLMRISYAVFCLKKKITTALTQTYQ